MQDPRSRLRRREFLVAGALGLAGWRSTPSGPPLLDAYPGRMSVLPGEELDLHVSTNARRYRVEVARVGARRQVLFQEGDIAGEFFPTPAGASMKGCGWPASIGIRTTPDWPSGIYSVILRALGRDGSEAFHETFFIVKPQRRGRRILWQVATNTYQAYNDWGGTCLYSGPDHPRVSFHRPFRMRETPLKPGTDWYNPNTNCFHTWDEPFIRWMERAGYEIDYCANLDLELTPSILRQYRLVLSVGHDEYWTAPMRDALEGFVAGGGNAAFFSGNTCCWQARSEENGRALVCHKRAHELDPVFAAADRRTLTTLWSDPLLGRPENRMTGVGFAHGGYNGLFGEFMEGPGAGEYTVHRPDHWAFAGTGLAAGDRFGREAGIAGYECDGCEFVIEDGLPVPTGRDGTPEGFQILATAPARWSRRDGTLGWARGIRKSWPDDPRKPANPVERDGAAVMGLYTKGGTVFTVGSCDWPDGLKAGDRAIERIVKNVLDRLSK